jgi:Type I phosphodiesterase / nucleotide pyrophosphatase
MVLAMSLIEAVFPDYRGANLARLIPSLFEPAGQRPDWLPATVQRAEQVVLFVVDGLGWMQLQERRHLAPVLASLEGGPITSVAPSTTACALTSLVVGRPPADHGVVGYRVVVDGPAGEEVMNVLKWRTASGDARPFVDPHRFQVLPAFEGHKVPVVSRADFAGTAFTEAHQRDARQVGWYVASSLPVDVSFLIRDGEPFVYAYYDGVDRVAHVRGFGDHYDTELVAVDRIVGDLLDALPQEAALVVTADHGQVQVGPRVRELDSRLRDRIYLLSGEARFRWLHAKDRSPAGVDQLAALAQDLYGEEAWVTTIDQAEADGWFGGPLRPEFRARLGQVAVVPFDPVGYLDHADSGEAQLVCRHGSLTAEEMLVPLVAGRGRLG